MELSGEWFYDKDDNYYDSNDGDNFLPDGEEIICPDCAKEKLMGPQAQ